MCTALKTYIDVRFKWPRGCKSHVGVVEMVDAYQIFSDIVRCKIQAMPKIHIMNFLYVTLLTPRFLRRLQGILENGFFPAILCTWNSFFQKNLWKKTLQYFMVYAD